MLDKMLARTDKGVLKKLNLKAYQADDANLKKTLVSIAAAPVVILGVPDPEEIDEIFSDSEMYRKICSAGTECLFKPFYKSTVYGHEDNGKAGILVEILDDVEMQGSVYGAHFGGVAALPIRFLHDDLKEVFKDNSSIDTNGAFLDMDAIAASTTYRKTIKRLYRKMTEGDDELTDAMEGYYQTLLEKIEGGEHAYTSSELLDYNMTVGEYALATMVVGHVVIRTVLSLGKMHICDYYPFVASREADKKRKPGKQKANPVLDPNKTMVRFIRKNVAEAHMVDDSEEKGTVRPHSRRGTWVTLRAERYKNHPMYQVENGVYRRESWPGCEPFPIGNVIYTPIKY